MKKFSGFPDDCSPEQLEKLEQFRNRCKEQGLDLQIFHDQYLLRFCRARKFEMVKVYTMWDNFIEWRKQIGIDDIENFEFDEIDIVRECYPHGYHKVDKMGRSIYIERLGKIDLERLFQHTSDERMIKYYTKGFEYLLNKIQPACTKAAGHRIDQTFTILDLNGVSLFSISKRIYNFIKLASSVSQDNYPEILGKMFIINAPYLFSGVWSIVKVWLDEKTQKKINISSGQSCLLEHVDKENLPQFLGGTSELQLTDHEILARNIGPWNPDGLEIYPSKKKILNLIEENFEDIDEKIAIKFK